MNCEGKVFNTFKKKCVENCPDGFILDKSRKICQFLIDEKFDPIINETSIKDIMSISRKQIINKLDIIVLNLLPSEDSDKISIIDGEDYSLNLYSTNIDELIIKT